MNAELTLVSDQGHATINNPAERALLAAVLTGHPAATEAFGLLSARDFNQPRNAAVWDACLAVHGAGSRVDPHTLPIPPKARPYIVDLLTSEAEPLNARQYAALVADAAQRRRLVAAAMKVRQLAETADDASRAAQDAVRAIDEAAEATTDVDAGMGAAELLMETIGTLESGDTRKVLTGWSDLDDSLGGMRPGQLVIVGARPGYGKSVVAANILAAACKDGIGVHFASLEMRRGEVMNRLLANQCTVDLGRLMNPDQLTEDDWQRIATKSGDMAEWPFVIDDHAGQTLTQIRARARASSRRFELGLVIVDYLQIMGTGVRTGAAPREQVIGDISQGLKELAKELDVPVLALSQVNRGPVDRKDPRPTMSDLRESGRIEADADQILLLHRPDLHEKDYPGTELEIHVAKNRNGPTGMTVALNFFGHYSRAAMQAWSPTRSLR